MNNQTPEQTVTVKYSDLEHLLSLINGIETPVVVYNPDHEKMTKAVVDVMQARAGSAASMIRKLMGNP